MRFYLCLSKSRKKLDKYFKINKIRNKSIIDIEEIILENNIDKNKNSDLDFLKMIVYQKIKDAESKEKDIYYLPAQESIEKNFKNVLKIKEHINKEYFFNLICFFNSLKKDNREILLNKLDIFDNAQLLEEY